MALGRFAFGLLPCLAVSALSAANRVSPERLELGRRIFEENWLRPPADDSPIALSRSGDGLGPLFNGASCAECHRLGGVGGAGPNEHNVELVSLALPLDANKTAVRAAARRAKRLHPEFLRESTIFLHRFGRGPDGSLQRYNEFHDSLRQAFPEEVLPASATQWTAEGGVPLQLAQRNTPALFGSGVIDEIPPVEVRRLAVAQKQQHPEMAGRPTDGGAGRFGWRGHVSSLEQFVRTACAVELGLRVRDRGGRTVRDQPAWPLEGAERNRPASPSVDMTESQVEALVAYVRALPAPRPVTPADIDDVVEAEKGEQTFTEIGCAVCHVRDVGPAKDLYSDLLLHDMGPQLADRVSAPLPPPRVFRQTVRPTQSGGGSGGGYSGGSASPPTPSRFVAAPPSLKEITAATQEFRTPPLWGVADSAPYLHDGRAPTLDAAIRQHAGQAHASAARYAALPEDDRGRVLAFLGTLRAPGATSPQE